MSSISSDSDNSGEAQSIISLSSDTEISDVTYKLESLDSPSKERPSFQDLSKRAACRRKKRKLFDIACEGADNLPANDCQTDSSDESEGSLTEVEDVSVPYDAQSEMVLFNDDPLTPVYKFTDVPVTTKDAFESIVLEKNSSKVATGCPTFVCKNVSFLVSLEKIGHWKDVLSDMMGKWKSTRVKHYCFSCNEENGQVIDESEFGEQGTFRVSRFIYQHQEAPDYHRVVIKVDCHTTKTVPFVYVQYYFDDGEHDVIPTLPHGKSKGKRETVPFQRTKESVKQSVKEKSSGSGPKKIVMESFENAGGFEGIRSAGDMARNRKQVSNFKYRENKEKVEDELVTVIDMCKAQERDKATAFLRHVSCAPEKTVFLGNERQLNDLARFCTNVENTSIVGIDPTYNMGKFYVTVTTYRQPMLYVKGTNQHPVLLGPCLIHTKKTFDSYFSLPSQMLRFRPDLSKIKVYGTDGEVNVSDPWKCCIPEGYHLLCDLHMKENIKSKLLELKVDQQCAKEYLKDIFGRDIGDQREPGIVDSWGPEEVDAKLASLKDVWVKRHPKGEAFYGYFEVHKKELIKACMTSGIRSIAGLGYPPKPYTQNANESMNNVLKAANDRKKHSLPQVIQNIHAVVRQQEQEVCMALCGKGEYEITPEYQQLKVEERRFYLMQPPQRKKLLDKFNKAQPVARSMVTLPCAASPQSMQRVSSIATDIPEERECHLSVHPQESGIGYPSMQILTDMSNKAYELLKSGKDIVQAPGSSTMDLFIVTNKENQTSPLTVKSYSNGKMECSRECWRFQAYKICHHCIAVAERLSRLKLFFSWFKKNVASSLDRLVNVNLPSGTGSKATKATQRRRGGRNKRQSVVTSYTQQETPNTQHQLQNVPLPDPLPGTYEVYPLRFCHKLTSKCFGCGSSLRSDAQADAVVIVSKEQRSYRDEATGQMNSKIGNTYYHATERCIKRKNAFFLPMFVYIPDQIKTYLSSEHKATLRTLGLPV